MKILHCTSVNQTSEISLKATIISEFVLPVTFFFLFKKNTEEQAGSLYQSYLNI